jgi:hypothetical protein
MTKTLLISTESKEILKISFKISNQPLHKFNHSMPKKTKNYPSLLKNIPKSLNSLKNSITMSPTKLLNFLKNSSILDNIKSKPNPNH